MTTPYYDSGVPPAGGAWPEDDPAGGSSDNATMQTVADTTPGGADGGRVYVFDLNTVLSPGRRYAASVGQVNVRCTDGVHLTRSGGMYVGIRLAPELALLGQAHAASSPGGTRPRSLPPSTPSWFQKLPCQ